jgi:anti-sigma B factor antagonist
MKFTVKNEEKYSQLTLHEDKLNSLISPALKSEIVKLNAEGVINIILNLGEVKYADSSGLSSILFGDRVCRDENGMFILAACNDHVIKLLRISQLDTILNIIPTVEESVDAVFMNELEKSFGAEENEEQP